MNLSKNKGSLFLQTGLGLLVGFGGTPRSGCNTRQASPKARETDAVHTHFSAKEEKLGLALSFRPQETAVLNLLWNKHVTIGAGSPSRS